AGPLEQLSAAQARRPRRRTGARGDLLLPDLAGAGIRPSDVVYGRRRVSDAHRQGRRRGAAAVRLSPRFLAAGLRALLSVGDGPRRPQARAARRPGASLDSRRATRLTWPFRRSIPAPASCATLLRARGAPRASPPARRRRSCFTMDASSWTPGRRR